MVNGDHCVIGCHMWPSTTVLPVLVCVKASCWHTLLDPAFHEGRAQVCFVLGSINHARHRHAEKGLPSWWRSSKLGLTPDNRLPAKPEQANRPALVSKTPNWKNRNLKGLSWRKDGERESEGLEASSPTSATLSSHLDKLLDLSTPLILYGHGGLDHPPKPLWTPTTYWILPELRRKWPGRMNEGPHPPLSGSVPILLCPPHPTPREVKYTEQFSNKYETKRVLGGHLHHKRKHYLAN